MRAIATLFFVLCSAMLTHAQGITGIVTDAASGGAIPEVIVHNVHRNTSVISNAGGRFSIQVSPGQLLEFRRVGYKTARLRLTTAAIPFYRIILETGVQELDEVEVRNHHQDYKHDSMRYRAYFKKQLEYPVLTGWRAIQSPFSAMGKTNQQMISFQREYEWLERQKYVDYTFNEKLIANLTGLKGDSAVQYMRRYRPSYEMLRSMQEYDYFTYVKRTVEIWRQRRDNSRGGSGGG